MRIVIHLTSHYDWQPVPHDVVPTPEDIAAKRVKPGVNGQWLMRVTRKVDTHTLVTIAEEQLIIFMQGDMIRDHVVHTRQEAIGIFLSRSVMWHHAHRNWMREIDMDDDGPDEELFRERALRQIAVGNIDADDLDEIVAAYMTPATTEHHRDHLKHHFGIHKRAQAKKS